MFVSTDVPFQQKYFALVILWAHPILVPGKLKMSLCFANSAAEQLHSVHCQAVLLDVLSC